MSDSDATPIGNGDASLSDFGALTWEAKLLYCFSEPPLSIDEMMDECLAGIQEMANDLGREGWELAGMSPHGHAGFFVSFRRRVLKSDPGTLQ